MKSVPVKIWFFFVISVAFATSCINFEQADEVPKIDFLDFDIALVNDDGSIYPYGFIEFEFIDGNADFGVFDWGPFVIDGQDTVPTPDSLRYNLFIVPLRQDNNGNYQLAEPDGDTIKLSIFYEEKLGRQGQYKTIKGKIKAHLTYISVPEYAKDTFRYEFYIYDQAYNRSQSDTTFKLCFKNLQVP